MAWENGVELDSMGRQFFERKKGSRAIGEDEVRRGSNFLMFFSFVWSWLFDFEIERKKRKTRYLGIEKWRPPTNQNVKSRLKKPFPILETWEIAGSKKFRNPYKVQVQAAKSLSKAGIFEFWWPNKAAKVAARNKFWQGWLEKVDNISVNPVKPW